MEKKSCLNFRVREAPLTAILGGKTIPVEAYKALVRTDTGQPLSMVGSGYKVVQNDELFDLITDEIIGQFPDAGCTIKDRIAHGGQYCHRYFTFRDVQVETTPGSKSSIAFSMLAQNAFGGAAIKLYVGGEDAFCTNGMMFGSFTRDYWKHSQNLHVENVKQPLRQAVQMFNEKGNIWLDWMTRAISRKRVASYLSTLGISETLQKKFICRFVCEATARGSTVWALYSAMTYYASHDSIEFPLRKTGTDHEQLTLVRRASRVRGWTESEAFLKLAA